jgi:hypothetical protein
MSSVTGIKVGDEKNRKKLYLVRTFQTEWNRASSVSVYLDRDAFLYALKASKGDVGKGRNIGGNHFVKDV